MPIPAVPITGSGLASPLLTATQYQRLTDDQGSTDGAVVQAIATALTMLQRETKRTFAYGKYREDQYLYGMGMVYPSATPIDRTKPIAAGVNLYTPDATSASTPASIIQGAGVWVGWFTPLPWMPVWTGVIPPQTVITYWGGWQPYGGPGGTTEALPAKLARIIARVAYYVLHPATIQPYGAKSTSAGGISMAGTLSSMMISDPQLRRDVRRWTRPQARAWDS